MQYIPCNSALLAQKTLFLTQKGTVFQIYKSFWIWEGPPPTHVGKNSQIISFFFMRAYLIINRIKYHLEFWHLSATEKEQRDPRPGYNILDLESHFYDNGFCKDF